MSTVPVVASVNDSVAKAAHLGRSAATRDAAPGARAQARRAGQRFSVPAEAALAAAICFAAAMLVRMTYPAVSISTICWAAGAAASAYLALRRMMSLPIGLALPFGGLYVLHPWVTPRIALAGPWLAAVPVVALLAWEDVRLRGRGRLTWVLASCLGVLLGAAWELSAANGIVLSAIAGACGLSSIGDHSHVDASATRRGGIRRCGLFLLAAALGWCGIQAVAFMGEARVVNWATQASAFPVDPITTPLAFTDRARFLAHRLRDLPADLVAGGDRAYLGWGLLLLGFLGFVANYSNASKPAPRVGAALMLLAFAVLWLRLGPASLHQQFTRLFAAATVQRQVPTDTLHLLGLFVVPLVLLPMTLFLSCRRPFEAARRRALGTLLFASAVVILWWTTGPDALGMGTSLRRLGNGSSAAAVVSLAWIAAAAAGLERTCAVGRRRSSRILTGIVVVLILVFDLTPVETTPSNRLSKSPEAASTNLPLRPAE